MHRAVRALLWLCLFALPALAAADPPSFLAFESGQVRPLALSPDNQRLFAVNTPDERLEIFDRDTVTGLLTHAGSVPVGMEPVAVAARTNDEVWVVNHLSDSVSVVDLSGAAPRVVRTLHVGDEPRDIVFAGTGGDRAFVTTAHRGQNSPNGGRINRTMPAAGDESGFQVPGTPRADVWVFDSGNLGSELGGTPLTVISLFGDKPRALAASSDGSRVYAAVFRSGNQTAAINQFLLCPTDPTHFANDTVQPACAFLIAPGGNPSVGGYPPPHQNQGTVDRPEVGLIVKKNRDGLSPSAWQDELGRDWSSMVRFDLPDRDVFEIDADANPPAPISAGASDGTQACADGSGCWSGVGTVLFNMVVHPTSGKIYVSNTDAQNHVRFEGQGSYATGKKPPGEPVTVQGNLAQARITVLDGASVAPRHLNSHIDYSVRPAPAGTSDDSLATPLGMAIDGATLYLAAFGSRKIAKLAISDLDGGTLVPSSSDHIELSGGGPTGVLAAGGRLYVLTRFDNAVAVLDPAQPSGSEEIQKLSLYNPEPQSVVDGRPFLYDARLTSSNGEASCASCHIFGRMDDLAWDLGDPDGNVANNTNPFNLPPGDGGQPRVFHPIKGPMTTQSLLGLANMGPEHWRGDRQGDENAAFTAFNVAFVGLLGRAAQLDAQDMDAFRAFALQLRYPPNPIRKLDNSLRSDEDMGMQIFTATGAHVGRITDGANTCVGCHELNAANGHFGGDGETTFDGETQHFKVPHLRNLYQKVGMFGMQTPIAGAVGPGFLGDPMPFANKGPQVRGFGFSHDGSFDTAFRFVSAAIFSLSDAEQDQVQAAMLSFPSDLAPIVGQQVTLHPGNAGDMAITDRVDLLEQRAGTAFTSKILGGAVTECDVVAHVLEAGAVRGYLYDPGNDEYVPDDGSAAIMNGALRSKAGSAEVTYTCVPPGSGTRVALDRDEDQLVNGVETGTGIFVGPGDTGTDPASKDSDGDGFEDGIEVLSLGSDPNDPLDPAPASIPVLTWLGGALLAATLGLSGARSRRAPRSRA